MYSHISGVKLAYGDNATVWDVKGKKYIDFTSGIFALSCGWNNRDVGWAVKQIIDKGLVHSYTFLTDIRERYCQRLIDMTGFETVYLFTTGAEATEAAYRVMSQYKGKQRILPMAGGFHGKTLGARMMSGRVSDWRIQWLPGETCGVIMEPYLPIDVHYHDRATTDKINTLIKEFSLLLCLDEVQAGFGRTGKMWGFEHYPDLKPDIVCFGKGAGSGYPVSGILGPAWIDEPIMDLSSTHGGNPLACAAGLAVLDIFEQFNLVDEARRKGEILKNELDCQGKGLVAAVILKSKEQADAVVIEAARRGLLLVHTHKHTVKIGPPLTIPDEDLIKGVKILKGVLHDKGV